MDKPLTQSDIDQLEKYADALFAKVGIDINFTRHFLDRVNDERNRKQITGAELARLFKLEYKRWGTSIPKLGDKKQAILKDLQTKLNIPFVLNWDKQNQEFDLIAKTVMRHPRFKSNAGEREFPVESIQMFEDVKPVDIDSIKKNDMYRIGGGSYPMYQVVKVTDDIVMYLKHASKRVSGKKKMDKEDFASIKGLNLFGLIPESLTSSTSWDYQRSGRQADRNDTAAAEFGRSSYNKFLPGAEGQTVKFVSRINKLTQELKDNKHLKTASKEMIEKLKDTLAATVMVLNDLMVNSDYSAEKFRDFDEAFDQIDMMIEGFNNSAKKSITEIRRDTSIPKDAHLSLTDVQDANDIMRDNDVVDNINGYDIYAGRTDARNNFMAYVVAAKDPDESAVGILKLTYNRDANGRQAPPISSEVWFADEIRGKGIALPLYKLAIKNSEWPIVSDTMQSVGSENLWKNLARDSEIDVYGWNQGQLRSDDKFFIWDPDEDPDEDVYAGMTKAELAAELESHRQELLAKIKAGDMSKEEAMDDMKQAREEMEKPSTAASRFTRLVATSKNNSKKVLDIREQVYYTGKHYQESQEEILETYHISTDNLIKHIKSAGDVRKKISDLRLFAKAKGK